MTPSWRAAPRCKVRAFAAALANKDRRPGLTPPLSFTYKDSDGDVVTVANQADLECALAEAKDTRPLILAVSGADDHGSTGGGDSDSDDDFIKVDYEERFVSQSEEVSIAHVAPQPPGAQTESVGRSATPESHVTPPSEVGDAIDDQHDDEFHDADLASSVHQLPAPPVPAPPQEQPSVDVEPLEPPAFVAVIEEPLGQVIGEIVVASEPIEFDAPAMAMAMTTTTTTTTTDQPLLETFTSRMQQVCTLLKQLVDAAGMPDGDRRALAMRLMEQPAVLRAVGEAFNQPSLQRAIADSAAKDVAGVASFPDTLTGAHLWSLLPVASQLAASCPELGNVVGLVVDLYAARCQAPRAAKSVHANVVCDGCEAKPERLAASQADGNRGPKQEIAGVRYKSAVLANYDVCATCEASGEFDEVAGPFIKIASPAMAQRLAPARPVAARPPPPPAPVPAVPVTTTTTPVVVVPSAPPPPPPRVTVLPAPGAMSCPQKHQLRQFCTPHGQFKCNVCDTRQAPGSVMFGCRPCDFDVCAQCSDRSNVGMPQAKFVADMTLTDGTVVEPGGVYIKTWRVRNTSPNIVWPADARLCNIGGAPLGAPPQGFSVPQARPGEIVDISCELHMPSEPGRYTSFWRLVTGPPNHQRFGHRMWVTVNVKDSLPANVTEDAVARMVDVGYANVDQVVRALSATQGDVQRAIAHIEEEQQPSPALDSDQQRAVATLVEAGFTDVDAVLRVLGECKGNVTEAVERLLNQ